MSDMEQMSSTTSHQSQAPLHLQRQALLYHLDMTLGNKIKKARKAKKMTLQSLADEIGVSKQLVWQWEKGDSDARMHIGALSKALEMPVEYFHGASQPPSTLEAKIKLLTPDNRTFMENMADQLLHRQETETPVPSKKA